jgi:hypothetical protein
MPRVIHADTVDEGCLDSLASVLTAVRARLIARGVYGSPAMVANDPHCHAFQFTRDARFGGLEDLRDARDRDGRLGGWQLPTLWSFPASLVLAAAFAVLAWVGYKLLRGYLRLVLAGYRKFLPFRAVPR